MEGKTLKLIDKTGPEKLQEFINELDKNQVIAVGDFLYDIGKIFKSYCNQKQEKKMTSPMRYYLQYSKNIGIDKEIGCAIRNCSDIDQPATNAEVILEFDNDGKTITVSGSGDFGGCTLDEFVELSKIVQPMIKEKLKLL